MHYKSKEFAISDKDWTIRPHEKYSNHEIGQRKRISQLDIERINKLYKCPDRYNVSLNISSAQVTVSIDMELTAPVPTISAHRSEKSSTGSSVEDTEDEEAPTTRKTVPPVKCT